ncbi:uncharacterized protein LOC129575828 [Sitodiplosis mosellana]|uniref:uncharacterized protein LOC129575828 n=1 Tax=Sitodiplosis mosellana TaxID=263140 RepID=UPI002444E4CB|nr:uncharacterized protein LOC129575828 [Sitodiplosis mosellana]
MEISLFLVFIFLCGWSINSSASAKQIQSFNTNETKLTDLEQLDFCELLNAANTNEEFSLAAADVFKRKFANKPILMKQSINVSNNEALVHDRYISISNHSIAVRVLEHFGSHILQLGIDNEFHENELKQLIGLIDQKCSNLTLLGIESRNWNILDDVQRRFNTVEAIAFKGKYNKLGSKTLNLNEMFPNVHNLTLGDIELKDVDDSVTNIPNLRYLQLIFANPNISDRDVFKNFIEKNPQIKELTLKNTNTSFVKFASEHLLNLDVLTLCPIKYVDYTGEIHFKNVKKFSLIGLDGTDRFENITFDDLEEFHCDPHGFPIWLDFIKPHRNLKKLEIVKGSSISDNDLILLSERATNLIEASIPCDSYVKVETLVRLLEESKHLKKLRLNDYGFPQSAGKLDALKARIEDKWTITLNERSSYYEIERKN